MINIQLAIDIFIESFVFNRSFTHPAEVVDVNGIRIVCDKVGRKGGERRKEVIVPLNSNVADNIGKIKKCDLDGKFILDDFRAMDCNLDVVKRDYKENGYRLARVEPLMAMKASDALTHNDLHQVQRVENIAQAQRVSKISGSKIMKPEHFSDVPRVKVYYVEKEGEIIAYCRCIMGLEGNFYLSDMFTREDYRRQGVASALLQSSMTDNIQGNSNQCVLLASKAGQLLYSHFGFTQIATLQMFNPNYSGSG